MAWGAVVPAAGLSSRMGRFKPMIKVGSISVAQRVVRTLQQAGVSVVVVVTGHRAEELERHLASEPNVVFVRNDLYRTTEMFDSLRLGLDYLMNVIARTERIEKVLLTPVDVPLFKANTVRALCSSDTQVAIPSFEGRRGHPVMVDATVARGMLQDDGEGGLRGAIARSGADATIVEVNDEGAAFDADTPSDMKRLIAIHNSQLIRPVVTVNLEREHTIMSNGLSKLMSLVDETGSVREACQRLGVSYSTGWNLLNVAEREMRTRLVERRRGGADGSKSELTPKGRELVERYRLFSEELRLAADRLFERHLRGFCLRAEPRWEGGPRRRYVYLMRHGAPSVPEGESVCLGSTDLPLSKFGRLQGALASARIPAHCSFTYASTLSRSLGTARLLSDEVRVVEGLEEPDNGEWEGLTFSEIKSRFPDLYRHRGDCPWVRPPGAESYESVERRARSALERIMAESFGDVAIVAHATVIRVLLCSLFGVGLACVPQLRIPLGAYVRLAFNGEEWYLDAKTESMLRASARAPQVIGTIPHPSLGGRVCASLMTAVGASEEVDGHCRAVAAVADEIGAALEEAGHCLNRDLIFTAARLHDLARAEPDHATCAATWLRTLGYAEVAEVIRQHHDLDDARCLDEAAVVFIADKLCAGTQRVTLAERFERSRGRCEGKEALGAHERRHRQALDVAALVNEVCGKDVVA